MSVEIKQIWWEQCMWNLLHHFVGLVWLLQHFLISTHINLGIVEIISYEKYQKRMII